MIERAARALTEHAYRTRGLVLTDSEWNGALQEGVIEGLRIALMTMLEPDEAMLVAGEAPIPAGEYSLSVRRELLKIIWGRMVLAA